MRLDKYGRRTLLSGRVVREMKMGLELAGKNLDVLRTAKLARAVQDSLEDSGFDVETVGLKRLRDKVLEAVRELG